LPIRYKRDFKQGCGFLNTHACFSSTEIGVEEPEPNPKPKRGSDGFTGQSSPITISDLKA
jgi:hypothetical protein